MRTCKLFFVIFIFFIQNTFAQTDEKKYAIFVDGGTTGTRVMLVGFNPNQKLRNSVPALEELSLHSVQTSVTSFINSSEYLPAYLNGLFDPVLVVLQTYNIDPKTVSLYFLSTGKMRLYPQETQDNLYSEIRKIVEPKYQFQIAAMETIKGEMEGVYSWLEVNYLLKNFNAFKRKGKVGYKETVGIIDMGTTSSQIAFETSGLEKSPNEFSLKINYKNYTIYRETFQGLGMDETFNAMIKSPDANSCFPLNYPMENGIKGKFDFDKCTDVYTKVIASYGFNRGTIPTYGNSFLAMSGFYYIYSFFDSIKSKSHTNFSSQVNTTCNRSWNDLLTQYPNEKYLYWNCANGVYFYDLVYHFYDLSAKNLQAVSKIQNKSVSWLRGATLYYLFN